MFWGTHGGKSWARNDLVEILGLCLHQIAPARGFLCSMGRKALSTSKSQPALKARSQVDQPVWILCQLRGAHQSSHAGQQLPSLWPRLTALPFSPSPLAHRAFCCSHLPRTPLLWPHHIPPPRESLLLDVWVSRLQVQMLNFPPHSEKSINLNDVCPLWNKLLIDF